MLQLTMMRFAGRCLSRTVIYSRCIAPLHSVGMSQAAAGSSSQQQQQCPAGGSPAGALDENLLALVVCPLAKTPLRYDAQQQLLINDSLGVAYPVVDGVPYLMPTHGKLLQHGQQAGDS